MILYRANATYAEIHNRVLALFHLQVIVDKPKPVDKQVMQAVGYCAEVRVKVACEPVFQSLSNLEKMYASLSYVHPRPNRRVVHTNMGMLFADPIPGDR